MESTKIEARPPFVPPRWIVSTAWKVHRGLFRVSGGRLGLRTPRSDRFGLAQLTTTGRRSGAPRSVMIGYIIVGGDLITLAMNGWDAADPAWWLNLQAEPSAELVLADGPVEVIGRAAVGAERDGLWRVWSELDPQLDAFAARRPDETAVVVLTPVPVSPRA